MSLPEGYIEGITRVSSLVEHAYPFTGTNAEKQYKDWLKRVKVDEKEYLKEACDVGTFVHLQMEHEVEGEPLDVGDKMFAKHQKEIMNGLNFMKDYSLTDMETEVYVRDKHERYQGSIDLVATSSEGKRILIDWKTWGIAKKRWSLPNKTAKPYDKLKKVALQMSLYAKALGNIEQIYVVWLHEEGYFAYELELVDDDKLEDLILSYQTKSLKLSPDTNLTINYDKMEILVQTPLPSNQYAKASILLQREDCDNGKTFEENIGNAVKMQKVLVDKIEKEVYGN